MRAALIVWEAEPRTIPGRRVAFKRDPDGSVPPPRAPAHCGAPLRVPRRAESGDRRLGLRRDQEVVGDRRHLLGFLPGALQLRELSLEGAPLLLLMRRHLERQKFRTREGEQAIVVLVARPVRDPPPAVLASLRP